MWRLASNPVTLAMVPRDSLSLWADYPASFGSRRLDVLQHAHSHPAPAERQSWNSRRRPTWRPDRLYLRSAHSRHVPYLPSPDSPPPNISANFDSFVIGKSDRFCAPSSLQDIVDLEFRCLISKLVVQEISPHSASVRAAAFPHQAHPCAAYLDSPQLLFLGERTDRPTSAKPEFLSVFQSLPHGRHIAAKALSNVPPLPGDVCSARYIESRPHVWL